MANQYHETITALEKQGTHREYIIGWASGFLGSAKREEQRVGEAYTAGYEDGVNKNTDNAKNWPSDS